MIDPSIHRGALVVTCSAARIRFARASVRGTQHAWAGSILTEIESRSGGRVRGTYGLEGIRIDRCTMGWTQYEVDPTVQPSRSRSRRTWVVPVRGSRRRYAPVVQTRTAAAASTLAESKVAGKLWHTRATQSDPPCYAHSPIFRDSIESGLDLICRPSHGPESN